MNASAETGAVAPAGAGSRSEVPDELDFGLPRGFLIRHVGGARRQVITGVIVGSILVLPVEWRFVSASPASIHDELLMAGLAFVLALVGGTLAGMFVPVQVARWGWMDDLLLVGCDPRDMMRRVRRQLWRYMLPHLAAIALVRVVWLLAQIAAPDTLRFSALVHYLTRPGAAFDDNALTLALLTAACWLLHALLPLIWEGCFWFSVWLLFLRRVGSPDDVALQLRTSWGTLELAWHLVATLLIFGMAFSVVQGLLTLGGVVAGMFAGIVLSVVPVVGHITAGMRDYPFGLIVVLSGICFIPSLLFARAVGAAFAGEEVRRAWGLGDAYAAVRQRSRATPARAQLKRGEAA